MRYADLMRPRLAMLLTIAVACVGDPPTPSTTAVKPDGAAPVADASAADADKGDSGDGGEEPLRPEPGCALVAASRLQSAEKGWMQTTEPAGQAPCGFSTEGMLCSTMADGGGLQPYNVNQWGLGTAVTTQRYVLRYGFNVLSMDEGSLILSQTRLPTSAALASSGPFTLSAWHSVKIVLTGNGATATLDGGSPNSLSAVGATLNNMGLVQLGPYIPAPSASQKASVLYRNVVLSKCP
jgi:hypothetical protein